MENQRIRLSKAMLKNGLLRLLENKPLSQITIYELCENAQINRTTFYKYYSSLTELILEIKEDFLRGLDEHVQNQRPDQCDAMTSVLDYLYSQRQIFCVLARVIPSGRFADELFATPGFVQLFEQAAQEKHLTPDQACYVRIYVCHGLFAVISEWLSGGRRETSGEIAQILSMLRKE